MPSVPPPPDSTPPDPPEEASTSSRPSRPSRPSQPAQPARASGPVKRPRFLLFALIGALVFGAGCWMDGCGRLAFYRGEQDPSLALNASIKSDTDRNRAEALYHRFTEVADAARKRAIPLAAATFVLGAALLALGSRALAGKTNTRGALLQVVIAQAAVVGLGYYLTADIRNAELDWEMERTLIHQRETLPADQYEQVVPMLQGIRRYGVPGWLVVRTLASALIVFALTRPRSREFFEAAGRPVSEG
ncbi:MAG: hypothetical protein JWO86_6457 [Myxococcaceae bacterium]|nr:hypothetical protein [Myxococcaceae bacterium]